MREEELKLAGFTLVFNSNKEDDTVFAVRVEDQAAFAFFITNYSGLARLRLLASVVPDWWQQATREVFIEYLNAELSVNILASD